MYRFALSCTVAPSMPQIVVCAFRRGVLLICESAIHVATMPLVVLAHGEVIWPLPASPALASFDKAKRSPSMVSVVWNPLALLSCLGAAKLSILAAALDPRVVSLGLLDPVDNTGKGPRTPFRHTARNAIQYCLLLPAHTPPSTQHFMTYSTVCAA